MRGEERVNRVWCATSQTPMSKAQAEWNPALLAAKWGTLCQRMLDVLNTPGYNKQSHKCNPHLGWCLQRNHGQLGQSLGVIFSGRQCKGMLYSQFLEEFRVAPGFPMPQPRQPVQCPAAPLPLGISLPSLWRFVCCQEFLWQQSCPVLFPCLCANKAGEERNVENIPAFLEKGRGFGSSTTAGCLHKQIPRLLIPFHV